MQNPFPIQPLEVFDLLADSIAVIDSKGEIVYTNKAWKSFTLDNGGDPSQLGVGTNYLQVGQNTTDTDRHEETEAIQGICKVITGEFPSYQLEYPCHSETEQRWFEMQCRRINDQLELYIISHRNISKRKIAEIELKKYNELLEETQAAAKVGGWELDLSTGQLYWTAETYRIHDTSPEEFNPTVDAGVGYFLPESKKIISEALDKAITEGIGYDLYLETYTTKGRKIDVRTTCKVTIENKKPIKLMGIFQDISEQKNRENQLIKSLKEVSDYKYAINQSAIVSITDTKGIINHVNDNFIKISKYSRDELIGKNHNIINSGYHSSKFWSDMWSTISNGEIWRSEIKNRSKDGSFYWVDTTIVPFIGQNGKIEQYIALRYEISKRKEKEEEILFHNTALKKANHELDSFVYRVSHDLRSPISSSLGIINLCFMSDPSEEIRLYLDKLLLSMNKLDKFITDILNYSRNSRMELKNSIINIEQFIHELIDQNKPHDIIFDIQINIDDSIPIILDHTRLVIVFNNLISNAFRFNAAHKNHPFLKIDVKSTMEEVQFVITDNGVGIEEQYLDRVFDMFFRATDINYGSGLGLYIAKEAVQKMKGEISVSSSRGKGTTFTVKLPNGAASVIGQVA